MSFYNLLEYSNNYSKTSVNLWQNCKYIQAVNNNGEIVDFALKNITDSCNFKEKTTGQTRQNETKEV